MINKKNAGNVVSTQGNDTTKGTNDTEKKIIKLNSDLTRKRSKTNRSELENREKSLTHKPQGEWNLKTESNAYYNVRELTFRTLAILFPKENAFEFFPPQLNLDALTDAINRTSKKSVISLMTYDARNYRVKIFRTDSPKGQFETLDVSKTIEPKTFLKRFGI